MFISAFVTVNSFEIIDEKLADDDEISGLFNVVLPPTLRLLEIDKLLNEAPVAIIYYIQSAYNKETQVSIKTSFFREGVIGETVGFPI